MQLTGPVSVRRQRRFGRGPMRLLSCCAPPRPVLSDDVKLFATTFLVGFLFVSLLIA